MAVAFRAISDAYGTGTNITAAEPAGTAQGDVLVAFIIAGAAATITPPSGWTTVYSGANASFDWLVCWIARGASAPDLTFGISSSVFRQVTIGAHTGANTSSPFSATANGGNLVTQNPDPPAGDPGTIDGMAVALCAHWSGASPFTPPTGYTQRNRVAELSDTGYATKPLTTTAAEDPGAFTGPGDTNNAYSATLLLQPAAAGGGATTTTPLRPDATVSNNWDVGLPALTAHDALSETITQPTAPDTNTSHVSTAVAGEVCEVGVADKTLGAGDAVTQTTLWVYAAGGAKRSMTVELRHGTTSLGTVTVGAGQAAGWVSVQSAAALTQTQVNDLRCRLTCNSTAGGGGQTAVTAYAAYIDLTTEGPAGTAFTQNPADSLAVSESLRGDATRAQADSATVADARAVDVTTPRADTLTVADNVSPVLGGAELTLNLADTAGVADTRATAVEAPRADSLTVADSAARAVERAAADSLTVGDSRAADAARLAADSLTVADSRRADTTAGRADTATVADATRADATAARADSLTVADSTATVAELATTRADSLTVADSAARAVERAAADSLTVGDSLTTGSTGATLEHGLADVAGIADTRRAGLEALHADTATVADDARRDTTAGRADTATVADATRADATAARADTLELADGVETSATGVPLERALADTAAVGDSTARDSTATLALADALAFADELTRAADVDARLTDAAAVTDTVAFYLPNYGIGYVAPVTPGHVATHTAGTDGGNGAGGVSIGSVGRILPTSPGHVLAPA